MAASCEPCLSKLVLLLLGGKQSGKSSAGNTILCRTVFQTTAGMARSSREKRSVFGKQVTVVDTPGWSSSSSSSTGSDSISREINRGLALCLPEPHAILLVLAATSPFGPEEWADMEVHLRLLQTSIWQRAMVLFTHGDELGALSIQEHVRRQGRSLQWLMERCRNRYHVLACKRGGVPSEQVQELLAKVAAMAGANARPGLIPQMKYSLLREEQIRREESKQRGGEGDVEKAAMHNGMEKKWGLVAPGVPADPGPTYSLMDPATLKNSLAFILLGRRVSGKSSAGNAILGRAAFQSGRKTAACTVGHGNISGRQITVVDTPGWSLFGLAKAQKVKLEIARSTSLCPAMSKVTILLAIPVDSFKEKDQLALKRYLCVLGDGVWKRTVVLFTYGAELRGRTIEGHIEEKGEPLQWVVERCGHRHCIFDKNMEDETQVSRLLGIVEHLRE